MERKFDVQIKVFESQFKPYTKSLDEIKNYLDQMLLLEESFAEEIVGLNAIRMVQEHYSFAAFIAVAILDSAVVCKNLLLAEFTWERVYQLRAATLLVYETINTYDEHTESLYRLSLKYPELQDDYKNLAAELKQFKKDFKYSTSMKDRRNITAGHIDKDFRNYYNTVITSTMDNGVEAVQRFMTFLEKVQHFMMKIDIVKKLEFTNVTDNLSVN